MLCRGAKQEGSHNAAQEPGAEPLHCLERLMFQPNSISDLSESLATLILRLLPELKMIQESSAAVRRAETLE